ncbi:hypothetical protein J6590_089898, partial [Homalodisca vitripennis]
MTGRFKTIHQYYPVRGHSFMPCDRTFGVVKRAVRRYDRIYSPEEYISIICNAKKKLPTYEVVAVQNEDITDFKTWWPLLFKKTPGSVQNVSDKFSLSKYRYIIYNSQEKGYVQTYEYIQGIVSATFRLAKTGEVSLPSAKAYGGTGLLPGPVQELHAVDVTDSEVVLSWEPPNDHSNVTDYVIHYNKVDNTSMHETLLKLDNQQNASDTTATIRGLDKGALYNIFVVSRNEHGTSLPSSLLLINTTKT